MVAMWWSQVPSHSTFLFGFLELTQASCLFWKFFFYWHATLSLDFPGGSVGKESACSVGDAGEMGSIPGWGRSSRGGHGNPLQYSCLENPMDRGAWQATVDGVAKSWTWLRDWALYKFKAYNIMIVCVCECENKIVDPQTIWVLGVPLPVPLLQWKLCILLSLPHMQRNW